MKTLLRWLGRLLLGIVILLLIGAAYIVYDLRTGEQTADNTNISFTGSDGTEISGYLATPDGGGDYPAVLLIHEWWGLNHGMTVLADALAAEGYVVFAPDAYRDNLAESVPGALYLRLFNAPDEQVHVDVDSALTWLRGRDDVDPERVASMGFCFGGGHSLQLGMRQSENIAVTVMYYGAVVTEPDLLRPFTDGLPVLGIFGEDDQSIPTQEVLEFEAALNSLDIENQITIYPGVGHAFLTEDNYDEPGTAGDAWQQTLTFLAEQLGESGGR